MGADPSVDIAPSAGIAYAPLPIPLFVSVGRILEMLRLPLVVVNYQHSKGISLWSLSSFRSTILW